MSHVPYIVGSCPIYCLVMSHILMSQVPYIVESCPIYCWVISLVKQSCLEEHVFRKKNKFSDIMYVSSINESCHCKMSHTHEWVMSHILLGDVIYKTNVFWRTRYLTLAMSHLWMSHVTAKCHTHMDESCLIYRWVVSPVKRARRQGHSLMNESCHFEM